MSIKFLLDENIPYALMEFLNNKGYSAEHLKKIDKVGIFHRSQKVVYTLGPKQSQIQQTSFPLKTCGNDFSSLFILRL